MGRKKKVEEKVKDSIVEDVKEPKKKKEEPKEEIVEELKEDPVKEELKKEESKMGLKEILIIIIVGTLCLVGSFLVVYSVVKEDNSSSSNTSEKRESKKKDNSKKDDKKENKTDTKTDSKTDTSKDEYVTVGKYKLKIGTYKGINHEYDETTGKTKDIEMTLTLTKTKITANGVSNEYVAKSDGYIYVGGTQLYEVTGNNKLTMLAGAGVDFEFSK